MFGIIVKKIMMKEMKTTHKSYAPGTEITNPDISGSGYKFVGWTGSVNSESTTVEMDVAPGGVILEAIFEKEAN